jgi:hypothetical protein
LKWLSGVLGRQRTTADQPFRIPDPSIGFLVLSGAAGALIAEADRAAIAPRFARQQMSDHDVPVCDVLFLYA